MVALVLEDGFLSDFYLQLFLEFGYHGLEELDLVLLVLNLRLNLQGDHVLDLLFIHLVPSCLDVELVLLEGPGHHTPPVELETVLLLLPPLDLLLHPLHPELVEPLLSVLVLHVRYPLQDQLVVVLLLQDLLLFLLQLLVDDVQFVNLLSLLDLQLLHPDVKLVCVSLFDQLRLVLNVELELQILLVYELDESSFCLKKLLFSVWFLWW